MYIYIKNSHVQKIRYGIYFGEIFFKNMYKSFLKIF